jgi:hypothetical protein
MVCPEISGTNRAVSSINPTTGSDALRLATSINVGKDMIFNPQKKWLFVSLLAT